MKIKLTLAKKITTEFIDYETVEWEALHEIEMKKDISLPLVGTELKPYSPLAGHSTFMPSRVYGHENTLQKNKSSIDITEKLIVANLGLSWYLKVQHPDHKDPTQTTFFYLRNYCLKFSGIFIWFVVNVSTNVNVTSLVNANVW
jgi:hypothetical protein